MLEVRQSKLAVMELKHEVDKEGIRESKLALDREEFYDQLDKKVLENAKSWIALMDEVDINWRNDPSLVRRLVSSLIIKLRLIYKL